MITNALSVDVEDWFHPEVFRDIFPPPVWSSLESRVETQTDSLLGILKASGVKATFFVLAWIAERHSGLVERIVEAGHEVACHGFSHTMITTQSREEFEIDLKNALRIIEEAGGVRPRGYRAPTFSIVEGTKWALEVLWDNGFLYDSSIYPIRHDRYGIPSAPRFPYPAIEKEGRTLWEVPGPTIRLGRLNLPAAGGGYLRLLPYAWTRAAIRAFNRAGWPANVFAHPWEFDEDLPRVNLPPVSRLRHYGGIGRNAAKLRRLLGEFRFAPIGELVRQLAAAGTQQGNTPRFQSRCSQ